jgi:hypothetical protein
MVKPMKKLLCTLLAFMFMTGCATMKYEPPKIDPVVKIAPYALPTSPFTNPPVPIFLKKDADGKWIVCPKEEATVVGYISTEHEKIVLRIQYDDEIIGHLVRLVNIHIDMVNSRAELERDQLLSKEVYKQMWVDEVNRGAIHNTYDTIEKGVLVVVIIAQVAALLSLVL